MTQKLIFSQLINNNIPFAVVVSENRFKNRSLDVFSRNYFIIISKTDSKTVKSRLFKKSENELLLERDLSENEVEYFKKSNSQFTKVLHNKYGRVYELKHISFRKYLEKVTEEN